MAKEKRDKGEHAEVHEQGTAARGKLSNRDYEKELYRLHVELVSAP